MNPLERMLLAVACYTPDKSEPHRLPPDMLDIPSDYADSLLTEAINRGLVRFYTDQAHWTYELSFAGRKALFAAVERGHSSMAE